MTKGLKSTEFWFSLIAVTVGATLATKGIPAEIIATVVAPVAVYSISRGIAKKGAA